MRWLSRFVFTLCLLPSISWGAAITVNATGTSQATVGATASPLSDTSLTIAAGDDTYLVCTLTSRDDAPPGLALTWNGVSLTQLNSQQQDTWTEYTYIFGLDAPATGNQTLQVSWTGGSSERITYRCLAFNNVGSVSGTLTNSSANNANPQGNITTASGDATVSSLSMSGSVTAVSHTQLYTDSNHGAAQYNLSTTSSDTHQYTMTSSNWGLAGIRLLQTSAGASTNFFRLRVNP